MKMANGLGNQITIKGLGRSLGCREEKGVAKVSGALAVYVAAFLVGVAVGSFLNVVINRLSGEKGLGAGRSLCPHCRTPWPWQDKLPLFSYFWLKGRCRFCRGSISWRYPAVELAGGLLGLALWLRFPGSSLLLVYGPFAAALLSLSAIDLEYSLLPDALTLPGIALGLALSLIFPHLTFLAAFLGALAGGASFFVLGWAYETLTGKRGMGGGDVKLLALIGAFLGIKPLFFVIFISAVLASLAGIGLAISGGRQKGQWRHTSIPYGPFLAIAALLYIFKGWG